MIAVDIDGLLPLHRLTGVERYTLCLANHFATNVDEMDVRVFTKRKTDQLDPTVTQVEVTGPEDLARAWLGARSKRQAEVYHLPYLPEHTVQLLPLALARRSVLMVHDLTFFHFPYLPDAERERRLRRLELTLRWATAIIANSEFTREDVLNEFDIEEEKVEVVYPGVKDQFLKALTDAELGAAARRLDLPGRFLLTVGKDYRHKNLIAAVEAYAEVLRSGHRELYLVMAGEECGREESTQLRKVIREKGLQRRVVRLGYVADDELVALYQLAAALVFPSLNEGFGFPALEAMVSGTPVVAVNRTSIPEVCADAALLVDNGTPDELAGAIRRVLEDEDLRARLILKGDRRAKRFSWDATAENTHRVYNRILDARFETASSREEREACWEEFHLLSYAEIAQTRRAFEGLLDGVERIKKKVPYNVYRSLRKRAGGAL